MVGRKHKLKRQRTHGRWMFCMLLNAFSVSYQDAAAIEASQGWYARQSSANRPGKTMSANTHSAQLKSELTSPIWRTYVSRRPAGAASPALTLFLRESKVMAGYRTTPYSTPRRSAMRSNPFSKNARLPTLPHPVFRSLYRRMALRAIRQVSDCSIRTELNERVVKMFPTHNPLL